MNYIFYPSHLKGQVDLPSSKSLSHRRIITGMLSKREMVLSHVLKCDDTIATLEALKALGGQYQWQNQNLWLDGSRLFHADNPCMCVEASASTLRFLIPICLTQAGTYVFEMADSLARRSIAPYIEALKGQATFAYQGHRLIVTGKLTGGHYVLDGSSSSQFISGMLMALPLLNQDSILTIQNGRVSKPYIALTTSILRAAHLKIEQHQETYHISGLQSYRFEDTLNEYDASSLAFLAVANYLGHEISWQNFETQYQADAKIFDILDEIQTQDVSINVKDMPDLVPILSLALALSPYRYELTHAKRLKDKESNRLESTYRALKAMGADIQMMEDGLMIRGVKKLKGAQISSYQDHRIAMMVAIAASVAEGETVLLEGDCVAKSWPKFYHDYQMLGGKMHEL